MGAVVCGKCACRARAWTATGQPPLVSAAWHVISCVARCIVSRRIPAATVLCLKLWPRCCYVCCCCCLCAADIEQRIALWSMMPVDNGESMHVSAGLAQCYRPGGCCSTLASTLAAASIADNDTYRASYSTAPAGGAAAETVTVDTCAPCTAAVGRYVLFLHSYQF